MSVREITPPLHKKTQKIFISGLLNRFSKDFSLEHGKSILKRVLKIVKKKKSISFFVDELITFLGA